MSDLQSIAPNRVDRIYSESYSLVTALITDLIHQCEHFTDIKASGDNSWNQRLSRLSMDVTQFVEMISLFSKFLKKNFLFSNEELKSPLFHLLSLMKAINIANQKMDFLVVDELINHELKDNLIQWKIIFLPQLKNLKQK